MIDFHSHVLPGMDDGSDSLETSIRMLCAEAEQGITHVVATPHFYAQQDKLDQFLYRREQAEKILREEMELYMGLPELVMGAEVSYFRGISESEFLRHLTIGKNRCVLIELPMPPWDESVFRELEAIWVRREILPIIAHIDRYITPWRSGAILKRIADLPVLVQANAEFFSKRKTAKLAMKMLKNDQIHLLGSDCHNMSSRKPDLGPVIEKITKKLGTDSLDRLSEYENKVLNDLP